MQPTVLVTPSSFYSASHAIARGVLATKHRGLVVLRLAPIVAGMLGRALVLVVVLLLWRFALCADVVAVPYVVQGLDGGLKLLNGLVDGLQESGKGLVVVLDSHGHGFLDFAVLEERDLYLSASPKT